jgi:hypothetical protein
VFSEKGGEPSANWHTIQFHQSRFTLSGLCNGSPENLLVSN